VKPNGKNQTKDVFRIYKKYLKYKILSILKDKLNHTIKEQFNLVIKIGKTKLEQRRDKEIKLSFFNDEYKLEYQKERTIREIIKVIENL
jgi:hypothetical protein